MSEVYAQPTLFEQTKRCTKCGEPKPLHEFSKQRKGVRACCKLCAAAQQRVYCERNPEKKRASDAAYRSANSERVREQVRTYYYEHREKCGELSRAYYQRNRVHAREMRNEWGRKWRDENRALHRAKAREYAHTHRDAMRVKAGRRHAMKRNAPVSDYRAAEWRETLGYFNYACGYCGATDVFLEQEHMQPLSRGGSHTAANIIPACISCNRRKSDRNLIGFLLSQTGVKLNHFIKSPGEILRQS